MFLWLCCISKWAYLIVVLLHLLDLVMYWFSADFGFLGHGLLSWLDLETLVTECHPDESEDREFGSCSAICYSGGI